MNRKVVSILAACALALSLGACGDSDKGTTAEPKTTEVAPWADGKLTTTDKDGVVLLQFPETAGPDKLVVQQVEAGKGAEIQSTDYVVANYTGQVWGKDTYFDSSFERKQPTGFSLEQVIQGWTQGLTGQKIGAKLIVIVPPELGYGPSGGNESAGIGKDDVIAFYIEIVDAYSKSQAGDPKAKLEADLTKLPVEITGAVGKPITVKVKADQEAPTEKQTIVLARGTGEPVGGPGTEVYFQVAASNWDNSLSEATYGQIGPQATAVQEGGLLDSLEGIPVGSRVLMLLPVQGTNDSANQKASALVIDILGQIKAADGAATSNK